MFSAIIDYEYTIRGEFNLHGNMLFRGGAAIANQTVPFSQFDSPNPEDLWRALDAFQKKSGSQVLAIPHNGNLSNGLMFSVETNDGRSLTKELVQLRARLEPVYEVTQIKGDGEDHPFLSPNDAFADYETWDDANLDGTEVKIPDMLQYEYARSALKLGLQLERKLGVNPFKFGMAGGTDAHTALSAVGEDNFFGKHSGVEPDPHRYEHIVIKSQKDPALTTFGWQQAASGRTAVWATENTREAIFDAMTRKEVYDVAWSGERKPGQDGKLPAVGNTVDVKNATWTNTIGVPELITYWQDPDFDLSQHAFYYARVIEIPTPRWTAYEARRYGITMPKEVPMTIQERAYTSPIWYSP